MGCPLCGETEVYIGGIHVECPTPNCPNFSEKQLEAALQKSEENLAHVIKGLGLEEDDFDFIIEGVWLRLLDNDVTLPSPGDSCD